MPLIKFRLVANQNDCRFRGEPVPKGTCKLILAGESEDDVRWFIETQCNWYAWKLERVDIPPTTPAEPEQRRGRQLQKA